MSLENRVQKEISYTVNIGALPNTPSKVVLETPMPDDATKGVRVTLYSSFRTPYVCWVIVIHH